jgi:galactokinase
MNEKKKRSNFASRVERVTKSFKNFFEIDPEDVFTSPGRIELLGNHTDHNNGIVLVSSIDLNILSVSTPTLDNEVIFYSEGYPLMKVDLSDLDRKESEYGESIGIVRGILFRFKELGYKIGGLKAATTTTIFKGAGVSSSAAFELLICKMMSYYYNDDSISEVELAKIAQYAEINYFNKPCGLLDQMGISLGSINYIDFRYIDKPYIRSLRSIFKNYELVLVNCKDSHAHLTTYYKKIKDDMALLSSHFSKEVLRDVDIKDFFKSRDTLISKYGEDVYLRGKHFYEENNRVRKAKDAILNNDEKELIRLINESGESSFYQLKNCYLKDITENLPQGILKSKEIIKDGAIRVHGGGFAGTILGVVSKDEVDSYVKEMRTMFGYNNVRRITTNRFGTRFVCKVKDVSKE